MAVPGQKRIRQLIQEKRGRITDRQLFTSRRFAAHLRNIVAAQSRRYNYARRVDINVIWEPKNDTTAHTDNNIIMINAASSLVLKQKERPQRYEIILGLLAHELGHVLYTDFLTSQVYQNKMSVGTWHPRKPVPHTAAHATNCADMLAFIGTDQYHAMAFLKEAHFLWNVMEDGFVNTLMLNRYPGSLGSCLEKLYTVISQIMPTIPECIEKEEDEYGHIWCSIAQLIVSYVACGIIKYDGVPKSDQRVQAVFSVMGELDRGVDNITADERWDIVNTIMMINWPTLKGYLEIVAELYKNNQALAMSLASAKSGTSKSGTGTTSSVEMPGSGGSSPSPSTAGKSRAATRAALKAESEDDEESDDDKNGGINPPEEKDDDDEQDALTESPNTGIPDEKSQQVTSDEQGRLPRGETPKIESGTTGVGGLDRDEDYDGVGYEKAASDIDRILENIAEDRVFNDLEKQRKTELNDLAQSISYGNAHEGIHVTVHRMQEVSDEMIEQYQSIAGPLLHISKLLRRQIEKQLNDRRKGMKQTGLLMGRRLNGSSLYRNDGRIFYKNNLPNEKADLAVGLLLDESGSMAGCDRATYARTTAIILYDFCRSLGIPIMVYGHSTTSGVDLYSYAEFESIDRNDQYRMMDISARSSNRDGAALRFAMEQVSRRPEEAKIVMLVSDGQPADSGYYGSAAEEDLRGIVQEYRRKGVHMIAAAIGEDRETIERIYGDAFLNISDLNALPVALAAKIKLYLRVS